MNIEGDTGRQNLKFRVRSQKIRTTRTDKRGVNEDKGGGMINLERPAG